MDYRKLYELYVKREKSRAIAGIVAGALGIAVNVTILMRIRDERRA